MRCAFLHETEYKNLAFAVCLAKIVENSAAMGKNVMAAARAPRTFCSHARRNLNNSSQVVRTGILLSDLHRMALFGIMGTPLSRGEGRLPARSVWRRRATRTPSVIPSLSRDAVTNKAPYYNKKRI